jgi:hypothetical protein
VTADPDPDDQLGMRRQALEQLAEVAPVVEDPVAQHEHRPQGAEHFDGGVDRASPPGR